MMGIVSELHRIARGFGAARDGLVSSWNRYEHSSAPPRQVELSPRQPSSVAHTQSALSTELRPSRSGYYVDASGFESRVPSMSVIPAMTASTRGDDYGTCSAPLIAARNLRKRTEPGQCCCLVFFSAVRRNNTGNAEDDSSDEKFSSTQAIY